jgi:hypothetical protein
MKIEAVTVCIGYSHYLEQIIENRHEVDRWVIVTHKDDVMTRRLCRKHDIETVLTERVFQNASFAKGRAVNDGLKVLDKDAWILHTDSDMLLPKNMKKEMEDYLDPKCLNYTIRRFKGDMPDYLKEKTDARIAINTDDRDEVMWVCGDPIVPELAPEEYHELNRRLGLHEKFLEGPSEYSPRPYGYFQLWHVPTTKVTEYSEISTNADIDDVYTSYEFYPKWNLLPIKVYDLNPWASNWDGPHPTALARISN